MKVNLNEQKVKNLSCTQLESRTLYVIVNSPDNTYNGCVGFIPNSRTEFVVLYSPKSLMVDGGGAWNDFRELKGFEFQKYNNIITLSNVENENF